MVQYSKMSAAELQVIREQVSKKIDAVDARATGRNTEVDEAFAAVKSDLQRKLNQIEAEISSR